RRAASVRSEPGSNSPIETRRAFPRSEAANTSNPAQSLGEVLFRTSLGTAVPARFSVRACYSDFRDQTDSPSEASGLLTAPRLRVKGGYAPLATMSGADEGGNLLRRSRTLASTIHLQRREHACHSRRKARATRRRGGWCSVRSTNASTS